jgi:molybdate transport system regulatory protein
MTKRIELKKRSGNTTLSGRIWIDRDDKNFLGLGKIIFLEKIHEYGSISKAASSEKMSYSRAWKLVESINSMSEKPLVIKSTGGTGGGGAELTEEGMRVIKLYWELCENFEGFLDSQKDILDKF